MEGLMNSHIDKANKDFWNELCGSGFAQYLGIKDHSEESLKRFDRGYLELYPYLLEHVKVSGMRDKKVIEVGLGYGTLGQKIAEAGAHYMGIDIAEGPVRMMNARMQMQGLSGKAVQASMLDCPIPSESIDRVVSIGCFHHTGSVQRCIDETYRVLKPGGTAMIMVYNQFSYRQWIKWPGKTFAAVLYDMKISRGKMEVDESQKGAYDANASGASAPETDFLSIRQLRGIFNKFSSVKFHKENCDEIIIRGKHVFKRTSLLSSLGKLMGLDIYIEARK